MFIVARKRDPEKFKQPDQYWELLGIFSTEEKALAACHGKFDFSTGPFSLDELLPDEVQEMPNVKFPNLDPNEYERGPNPTVGNNYKVEL